MSIFLSKLKNFFSVLGALLAAGLGIFFMGRRSVPKGITLKHLDKAKKEVKREQKGKNVFQKLKDMDSSINRF